MDEVWHNYRVSRLIPKSAARDNRKAPDDGPPKHDLGHAANTGLGRELHACHTARSIFGPDWKVRPKPEARAKGYKAQPKARGKGSRTAPPGPRPPGAHRGAPSVDPLGAPSLRVQPYPFHLKIKTHARGGLWGALGGPGGPEATTARRKQIPLVLPRNSIVGPRSPSRFSRPRRARAPRAFSRSSRRYRWRGPRDAGRESSPRGTC